MRKTVATSYEKITYEPSVVRVTGRQELSPITAIIFAGLAGLAAWLGYEKAGPAFADYNGFTEDDTPPEFLLVNFRLPFMILLFGHAIQLLLDIRSPFVRTPGDFEESTHLLANNRRSENPNQPFKEIALRYQDKWEIVWKYVEIVFRRLFHHGLAFCPTMLPALPQQLSLILDSDWLADEGNRLFLSKFLTGIGMALQVGLAESGLGSHAWKYTLFHQDSKLIEYKSQLNLVEQEEKDEKEPDNNPFNNV